MSQTPEPANHDHQTRPYGRGLSADFDHDPERFPPTSWRPRTSRLLATCMIGWPINSPDHERSYP